MIKCQWCNQLGLPSIYPGVVNSERIIQICTQCANIYRKPNNTWVSFTETGIQRHLRENYPNTLHNGLAKGVKHHGGGVLEIEY